MYAYFPFFVFYPSPFCRSPCPIPSSFFARFCPFVLSFSVWFLYRLLRFYFRFPAFLCGGFCCSVISSRRYTPPALLASLKYTYSPCMLSYFLSETSCVADIGLSLFFLIFHPFFDFDFDIACFILSFSCGYYAVSSVSVSAATRLAYALRMIPIYQVCMYLDTCVRTLISPLYVCLRYTICFSYRFIIFSFHLFSSWGNFPLQSYLYWSLFCDHGLHCSHELMWEQQQQQQQQQQKHNHMALERSRRDRFFSQNVTRKIVRRSYSPRCRENQLGNSSEGGALYLAWYLVPRSICIVTVVAVARDSNSGGRIFVAIVNLCVCVQPSRS